MHRHSRPIFGAALLIALALVLAACGSSDKSSGSSNTSGSTSAGAYGATTPTTASTSTTGGGATDTATVAVATSSLGKILVDSKGMTLYVFNSDTTAGKSSCNGPCATAWPPLAATGTPTYGTGLNAAMFSTITRDDGSSQLAVNGHPLYHWQNDAKAGDTTGQGVNGFYVVGTDGNKIT